MDAPVATDLLSGCCVILGGSTVRKKEGKLTGQRLVACDHSVGKDVTNTWF